MMVFFVVIREQLAALLKIVLRDVEARAYQGD